MVCPQKTHKAPKFHSGSSFFTVITLHFGCIFYGTAECTAADAFKYGGDDIVFASGSPFENVQLGNFPSSQLLLCLESLWCCAVKRKLVLFLFLC